MSKQRYPKTNRLRKSCEYLYLSRYGKRYFSYHFIVIAGTNNKSRSRLGVTVSKKVGNASTRNRIKRVVREYFRLHIKRTMKGNDINVIARKGLGVVCSAEIFQRLSKLFATIINKRTPLIRNKDA